MLDANLTVKKIDVVVFISWDIRLQNKNIHMMVQKTSDK